MCSPIWCETEELRAKIIEENKDWNRQVLYSRVTSRGATAVCTRNTTYTDCITLVCIVQYLYAVYKHMCSPVWCETK